MIQDENCLSEYGPSAKFIRASRLCPNKRGNLNVYEWGRENLKAGYRRFQRHVLGINREERIMDLDDLAIILLKISAVETIDEGKKMMEGLDNFCMTYGKRCQMQIKKITNPDYTNAFLFSYVLPSNSQQHL